MQIDSFIVAERCSKKNGGGGETVEKILSQVKPQGKGHFTSVTMGA